MKALEWILNSVFSIVSLWDRSYDELLNEHRAYERRILIYTVMAVILMLAATIITPSPEMQPSDGIKYATYFVYKYIGMGALLLGTYSAIALLWNLAGLVYFRHKHGLTD
jgi:hypothetical protein